VARVEVGLEHQGGAGTVRREGRAVATEPAVVLLVQPLPGEAGRVDAAVGKVLAEVSAALPPGVTARALAFGRDDLTATFPVPPGMSLEAQNHLGRAAAEAAVRVPEVRSACWLAAPDESTVTVLISLAKSERGRAAARAAVRAELARPGSTVSVAGFHPPLDLWPGDGAQVVARLYGDDAGALRQAADALRQRLTGVPGLIDLTADTADQVYVDPQIDQKKLAHLGVPPADAREAVALLLGGVYVGESTHGVTVNLGGAFRDPAAVEALHIRNNQGQFVPLRTFVTVTNVVAPARVYRDGGRRCVVVGCNVQDRDVALMRAAVRKLAAELAQPGVRVEVD
jgi:HME family heavy-metal exporter